MTTEKYCLEKPRKPLVPLKTLDIIFRRRYVPNTQKYFTNRKHAVTDTVLSTKKKNYFCVPRSQKLVSYIKYSDRQVKLTSLKRLAQPLHLKDNIRVADTRDLSQRLYIEETPDDVKCVVAIHPEFYTVIEGRPIRSFDDIKVYMSNIRAYAMMRQQIGYKRDLTIKLERNIIDENREYNVISNNFKKHLTDFQHFLTEDYKKSMAKTTKAEKNYQELIAKNNELLGWVSELIILNNVVFKLDAVRGVLKMYRTYCLFVAPLFWRQIYDETLRGKLMSIQFESGAFATDNDLVESLDIEKTVELAKIELKNPPPAHIYFKSPKEMIYLFRTLEMQSREYLIQLSRSSAPYRILQDRKRKLNCSTTMETDYFQWNINFLEKEIARETYNELYLEEKFFRILNETFYDTVASPDTLKLKICIEFVYEQIFGKCEEGHQTISDPMKILEVFYEEYNLRLDSLDFKTVKKARTDCFAQDLAMMRDAVLAQRILREFYEMSKSIHKAFESPAQYKRPVFSKFVDKKTLKAMADAEKEKARLARGERVKIKEYKVTPEEREALLFFTEWCDGTDPAPYLKEYELYAKRALESKSVPDFDAH